MASCYLENGKVWKGDMRLLPFLEKTTKGWVRWGFNLAWKLSTWLLKCFPIHKQRMGKEFWGAWEGKYIPRQECILQEGQCVFWEYCSLATYTVSWALFFSVWNETYKIWHHCSIGNKSGQKSIYKFNERQWLREESHYSFCTQMVPTQLHDLVLVLMHSLCTTQLLNMLSRLCAGWASRQFHTFMNPENVVGQKLMTRECLDGGGEPSYF